MKRIALVFMLLAVVSCGNDEKEDKPARFADSGTLLVGAVGGNERFGFPDGTSVNFIVSGNMAVRVPNGVVEGKSFPAEVTFSVRSVTGTTLSGKVNFTDLKAAGDGSFQGDIAAPVTASIVGMFEVVTNTTILDVQGFSYALPVTGDRTRKLILQGANLREREVEPLP